MFGSELQDLLQSGDAGQQRALAMRAGLTAMAAYCGGANGFKEACDAAALAQVFQAVATKGIL